MKTPEFRSQQNLIASERNRRLTTYLGALTAMRDNRKSDPEMLQWLQQQGEKCSTARLKEFFRHCRHLQKIENRWSELTASKESSAGVQEFLKNNPPPEVATVVALLRHLIVQPAPGGKNGKVTGETVQLTDRLARTLLTYELALKKLDQRERSLKLAEQKWEKQAAKKVEVAGDKWGEEAEERGDFDHTEKIAAMRKAYFKDVDDLLASGTLIIPEA